jgi:hypothetical protein
VPTNRHLRFELQETPLDSNPDGDESGDTTHRCPVQRIRVFTVEVSVSSKPTAQHLTFDGHATPVRPPIPDPGLDDHRDPFQCSSCVPYVPLDAL